MKKVYEVEYIVNNGTSRIKVRANDTAEAKRIAKTYTNCLIKNMRIFATYGTAFKAVND